MTPLTGRAGPGGKAGEPAYEGLFNRSVAIAIDNAVWLFAVLTLFSYMPASLQSDVTFTVAYFFIATSLWFNYFAFCEWRWGRTLGKQAMGMKVVAADGGDIGFGPASVRGIMRLVDFFVVGEVMIASSERRQRLGDKLAGTVVVRTRAEHPPAPAKPAPAKPARDARKAPAPAKAAGPRYASVPGRIASYLFDWVVAIFALSLLGGLIAAAAGLSEQDAVSVSVVVLVIGYFNYFAISEWRWGQTLGKRLIGLRVESLKSDRVSFASSLWRALLQLVDVWLVGPLMIASSDRHQRLGDLAAGTTVVRTRGADRPEAVAIRGSAGSARLARSGGEPGGSAPDETRPVRGRGLPWVTWSAGTAALGLLAGLGLGAILAPLLVIPFDPDLSSLGATLAAQALLTVAILATAVHIARREGDVDVRGGLRRLGLRRFRPSALALALGTLFVYFIAVAVYVSIFGEPKQEDVGADLGLDQGLLASIAAVTLIAVAAPIAEETFFRGFFYGGLRSRLPTVAAAVISGLVFGAVHAPEGPTAVVPLALLGIALALLYERTGSLWPCIFAHCLNNSLALAVAS